MLFSIVDVLIYIPAVYEDSFFPTSLSTYVVFVLDDSHSNRSEMKS
jgi:hypothetical protein